MWPLAGYWSYTEYTAPVQCSITDACVGTPPLESWHTDKQCAEAYTGTRCGQCADGFYQLNGQCVVCSASVDQRSALTLALLGACCFVLVLAFFIATLNAVTLAHAVTAVIMLQEAIQVGIEASRQLPQYSEPVSTVFTYLNILNFDVEVLRPGCAGVPTFTWIRKLRLTLLFMVFAAVVCVVACCIRYVYKEWNRRRYRSAAHQRQVDEHVHVNNVGSSSAEDTPKTLSVSDVQASAPLSITTQPEVALRTDQETLFLQLQRNIRLQFLWRLEHALLILGAVMYLRLTTLQLQGFHCQMAPDPVTSQASDAVVTESLYLTIDFSTRCYEGQHLGAIIGVVFLLVFYTIGFPLLCFVLLVRAFANDQTSGIIGVLYRSWRCLNHRSVDDAAAIAYKPSQWHKLAGDGKAADGSVDVQAVLQKRSARYGFLFLNFKADHFAFSLQGFLVNLYVAIVSVFAESNALAQVFLFALAGVVQSMLIAVMLPYQNMSHNLRRALIRIVTVVHAVVLLGVQSNGTQSAFFAVAVALLAVAVVAVTYRHRFELCLCSCRRRAPCQGKEEMPKADAVSELPLESNPALMASPADSLAEPSCHRRIDSLDSVAPFSVELAVVHTSTQMPVDEGVEGQQQLATSTASDAPSPDSTSQTNHDAI